MFLALSFTVESFLLSTLMKSLIKKKKNPNEFVYVYEEMEDIQINTLIAFHITSL